MPIYTEFHGRVRFNSEIRESSNRKTYLSWLMTVKTRRGRDQNGNTINSYQDVRCNLFSENMANLEKLRDQFTEGKLMNIRGILRDPYKYYQQNEKVPENLVVQNSVIVRDFEFTEPLRRDQSQQNRPATSNDNPQSVDPSDDDIPF